MAKVHYVKAARKDIVRGGEVYIKKGESYYWWQLYRCPKRVSKTYPKRSQLTQSSFLQSLYDLEDNISEYQYTSGEDLASFRDEIVSQIDEMIDECQSSLDNMPEQLQYAPTGELLQERIDGLESWKSELENLDFEDYDEDSDQTEEEWGQEKLEELQLITCEIS